MISTDDLISSWLNILVCKYSQELQMLPSFMWLKKNTWHSKLWRRSMGLSISLKINIYHFTVTHPSKELWRLLSSKFSFSLIVWWNKYRCGVVFLTFFLPYFWSKVISFSFLCCLVPILLEVHPYIYFIFTYKFKPSFFVQFKHGTLTWSVMVCTSKYSNVLHSKSLVVACLYISRIFCSSKEVATYTSKQ